MKMHIFTQLFCDTCPNLDIKSSNEGRGRRAENSGVFGRICDIFNGVTRENMLNRFKLIIGLSNLHNIGSYNDVVRCIKEN
jgi:hypothetical protein